MVARAVNCNEFAGTQCEYEKLYCRAIHDRPYDINLMFIALLEHFCRAGIASPPLHQFD